MENIAGTILKFTEPKAVFSMAGCLFIRAEDGKVLMRSMASGKNASAEFAAEITEEGEACVSAKKFATALSCFLGDEITLNTDGKVLKLSAKGVRTKASLVLFSQGNTLVPEMPESKGDGIEISPAFFTETIKPLCANAADERNGIEQLRCVCFEKAEDTLRICATNRKSLIIASVPCKGKFAKTTVSAPVLALLAQCLGQTDTVKIMNAGKGITVTAGIYTFHVSGFGDAAKYPEYMRVLPEGYTDGMAVDADMLASKIKSLSKLCETESRRMLLTLAKDGMIIGSCESDLSGEDAVEAEDFIPYLTGEGPDEECPFLINYELLTDLVIPCKGMNLKIFHSGDGNSKAPLLLDATERNAEAEGEAEKAGCRIQGVLMPMHPSGIIKDKDSGNGKSDEE